ncbi:hypothetical protein ACFZAG_29630 [Streptomyces sp. NPDC012403]
MSELPPFSPTVTLLTVGRVRKAAFAHHRAERAQRGGGIRSVGSALFTR